VFNGQVEAAKPTSACTTIQSGELIASDLSVITTGYDQWGYNYQAHMFNGKYCDAYRDADWCQPYSEDNLMMKWNNVWLSNTDCDEDGLLDRHFGFNSYIGSGAWLTNHQSGTYEDEEYQTYKLLKKDPITWKPVLEGASGELIFGDEDFTFTAEGLEPMLVYGLMYYPESWPDVECIGQGQTDEYGNLELIGDFDFLGLPSEFKIWLVPISDFSCTNGFTSWNPGNYLFEESMIPSPVIQTWSYFTKIVAVPSDADFHDGIWYTAVDGKEIGPMIWGEFATILEIYNDTGTEEYGVTYKGEAPTGFGFYKPM